LPRGARCGRRRAANPAPVRAPAWHGARSTGARAARRRHQDDLDCTRPDERDGKRHPGEKEVDYRGKVCVDAGGAPTSVRAVHGTGDRAVDRKVERTVLAWRYAPIQVAGQPQPFCADVRYRFELPAAGLPGSALSR
jgi:TonB family protein